MDGFLGIDIGTTNSKALLISENGKLMKSWKKRTPEKSINGRRYIDILAIEQIFQYRGVRSTREKRCCHVNAACVV